MGKYIDLLVPDIGDFTDVPVIELLVGPGDLLTPDIAVITLESDKATMEVPADVNGVVTEILVEEGDTVSEGCLILRYMEQSETAVTDEVVIAVEATSSPRTEAEVAGCNSGERKGEDVNFSRERMGVGNARGPAGPAVRRLSRELGVDLQRVAGSGSKGRITKEDVRAYVKESMLRGGVVKEKEPVIIDFSQFGDIEEMNLSRIQKISGKQLAGNWAAIPHVTSFDEADITNLELFRKELNREQSMKLTLLPFVIKAVQLILQDFPQLNSSLQGDTLVVKKYYNIGCAVDTPAGLMVAVVHDVDRKGVLQIGEEVKELAMLAREGKLVPEQMQGGTFTISSLGSVGGTYFTPIVNAPEVAILALGRSSMQPFWDGEQFVPRLKLPLSLSWDHRALDGVTASRFNVKLCDLLADFRRAIL